MLPESVGAMKRVSAEGEKGGAMGIVVSHAEGRYENEGKSLQVKITDPNGASAFWEVLYAGDIGNVGLYRALALKRWV